jgi:hypothetical protein
VNFSTSSFRNWFFIWVLSWLIPFGGLLVATELLIRSRIAPADNFTWHHKLFHSTDAKNVVFGDSHAALGFTGVEGFVNLASPSENFPVIEAKVRHYVEKNHPRRVIVAADPNLLSLSRDVQELKPVLSDYFKPRVFEIMSYRHSMNIVEYWKVYFKKGDFKSGRVFQPDGAQTSSDSMTESYKSESSIQKNIERVQIQVPMENFEQSRSAGAFRAILDLLKDKGVETCVVSFPAAPQYVDEARKYPSFEASLRYYQEESETRGFKYLNYWTAVSDYGLFQNSDHLNHKGATILAPKVVKECFGHEKGSR